MKPTFVAACILALLHAALESPIAAADPAYDQAAGNAFIRLLADRGMLETGATTSELIQTGHGVCNWADSGASFESIENYVHAVTTPKVTDTWVTIFIPLSIRTFCPPTPKDRSW